MPTIIDVRRGWRTRLQVARDPGLLAVAGAVLLMCAPVLPGPSRLVVLPALLLAPGYALLRLLGQATGMRSISVAVPVSLVLAVCASLLLNVSGIRLGPVSLGLLLGAVTALFLAGSYSRSFLADSYSRSFLAGSYSRSFLAGSYSRSLTGGWPASPKPPSPRPPPPPRKPPPPKLGPWGQPDFSDTEPIPVIKDPENLWSGADEGPADHRLCRRQ